MKFSKLFRVAFLLCAATEFTFAQSNFIGYVMPSATVKYSLNPKFSQNFGIEDRNFAYRSKDVGLWVKHLELAHFTKYEFTKGHQFGLGVSYRFEADEKRENELRLMQQYEWKNVKAPKITHRLRAEERIYASLTKYRFRYQTKFTFPTKVFFDRVSVANELALEVNSAKKPNYEERIAVFAEWKLFSKSHFELGSQYRLSDFTENVSHNLFLCATLNIEI